MELMTAKLSSKGQVTLPKSLRDSLGIHEGDRIEFSVSKSGQACLRRLQPTGKSSGALKHLAKAQPVSVEDMDAAIAQKARSRFAKP